MEALLDRLCILGYDKDLRPKNKPPLSRYGMGCACVMLRVGLSSCLCQRCMCVGHSSLGRPLHSFHDTFGIRVFDGQAGCASR